MKEKPNEWVAISDLMAGVMAVVMLLLVISVLQNTFMKVKHAQQVSNLTTELDSVLKLFNLTEGQEHDLPEMKRLITLNNKQQIKVSEMLKDLEQLFSQENTDGLVFFNIEESKITLKDNIFSRSSACITPKAKKAISILESTIEQFLNDFKSARVYVEGHTDNIPVRKPVVDFQKYCTVYDDNYTLSAARAREARKVLIGDLQGSLAKRVVVAGYGDSNPIVGIEPSDAKNRRVEVRFIIDAKLN